MAWLFSSFAEQDGADSAEHDAEIKPNRPILDVIEVESAAFFEGDAAAAGDLSEAGHARLNGKEERAVAVAAELAGDEGAGADERDVAADNVEELRELVEGG